jgi:hypothetical protein
MSVTFSVEALPVGTFTAKCGEDGPIIAHVGAYETAVAAVTTHQATCEECTHYRPFVSADVDVDGPEVNMANANAARVLLALDLDTEDMCGHEDGAAFLARVLVALGTDRVDAEVPTREGRNLPGMPAMFGDAYVIDCGTPAGYVTERLEQLHEVAAEAARLGRSVQWA